MSNIYKTLFCGTDQEPLAKKQQAMFDEFTAKAQAEFNQMTEEEKIRYFKEMMNRK
jgi:hypothetical protein